MSLPEVPVFAAMAFVRCLKLPKDRVDPLDMDDVLIFVLPFALVMKVIQLSDGVLQL